MRVQVVLQVP